MNQASSATPIAGSSTSPALNKSATSIVSPRATFNIIDITPKVSHSRTIATAIPIKFSEGCKWPQRA